MGIKSIIFAFTPSNIAYYTAWGYVSYRLLNVSVIFILFSLSVFIFANNIIDELIFNVQESILIPEEELGKRTR